MKKAKSLIKLLALSLAGVMCFGMAACGDNNRGDNGDNGDQNQNVTPAPAVGISIEEPATTTLYRNYTATLKVTVTGTDDKAYFWNVTDANGAPSTVLTVSKEDVVSVAAAVTADTPITVTATAHADTTKKASVTFTVKPTLSGENGELNADLFEEVSNENITVKGTLTDYYVDTNNTKNNDTTSYDMTVKMDTDKWYGAWSRYSDGKIDTNNVVEQNYKKGLSIDSSKYNGVSGHETLEVYVDKNNQSATKTMKDYNSVPVAWESMHLSNGFRYFGTNITDKYTYDTTNDVYEYVADFGAGETLDTTDDAWQLTYLGLYFTPLLEGTSTIVELRLKVENEHITTLYGKTATDTISVDGEGKPVQYEYTEIELHFSDSGETVVPEATPYDEPEEVEVLQNAITKMKAATSYTFASVEHAMSAPQPDEGDYTVDMALTASNDVVNTAYSDHTAAKATVGRKGWVTESIVLFEDTMEYTSYMDDPYAISYKGFKNRSDGKYEDFKNENGKFTGQRVHNGTVKENVFPKFDFSPNLFKFNGTARKQINGAYEEVYEFVLRDTAVTRDISKEISLWTYAEDATAMAFSTLTLRVTKNGDLYQTEIPYSYASGNYTGYVTTTFTDINGTTLDAADFSGENYAERVVKMNWTEYVTQDYSPNTHSNLDENDNADTNVVLEHLFGTGWASFIPQPSVFIDLLGDMLSGPWFDYNVKPTDADGKEIEWYDHFDFTVGDKDADYVDENSKIIDVESFLGPNGSFAQVLATLGYVYVPANSGYSHGSYYACYLNAEKNVLIKVDNIGTAFFYFEIYNEPDAWHLNRG